MNEPFEVLILQLMDQRYGVIDTLLSPTLLQQLRRALEVRLDAGRFKAAGIGQQSDFHRDPSYRSDQIDWIDPHLKEGPEAEFLSLMHGFMDYLNRTCFTSLKSCEFHFARYEQGSFYKRHLDQFRSDSGRQFSVVTYLNDDWTEADGGSLVLYLPEGPQQILPLGGRTVFFKSDELEHEVLPAKKDRLSMTGWLKN